MKCMLNNTLIKSNPMSCFLLTEPTCRKSLSQQNVKNHTECGGICDQNFSMPSSGRSQLSSSSSFLTFGTSGLYCPGRPPGPPGRGRLKRCKTDRYETFLFKGREGT